MGSVPNHRGTPIAGGLTPEERRGARTASNSAATALAAAAKNSAVVRTAAFTADGTKAVTTSPDGIARVWDATTGATVAIIKGYLNRFLSTHIKPQAMTPSTPVLGSGILAKRNPVLGLSPHGLPGYRPEDGK